jgi:hypothetical protein
MFIPNGWEVCDSFEEINPLVLQDFLDFVEYIRHTSCLGRER